MRTLVLALALFSVPAWADNVLHLGTPSLDRPTVIALGVRWPLTGDDNFDATAAVRYRVQGTTAWTQGMPLYRVRPALVMAGTAVSEFAGSIFDLKPATTYEIELAGHDPDGGDITVTITGTTRPVPADPANPNVVNVSNATQLTAALNGAQPGDVITLAAGTYTGEFVLNASGTAANPIVIRGVDRDTVIIDGANGGSNVLACEGSYTHVENLTLQHDTRALRFHLQGAAGNVVRRVKIADVILGIGSNPDQQDFYICDNLMQGRLSWPLVYADDQGLHANDDGIHVQGDGHVVCHNTIGGFGDAMKIEQDGSRAVDFYGNDVNGSYDNGLELDSTSGNSRAWRNRFTNTYMPLSFQPIYGGPAYAIRNVVVNAANEPLKLHNNTVGPVILNNTFVAVGYAMQVNDGTTAHALIIENNLFVGPNPPTGGRTLDWDQPMDPSTDLIDWNGWFPDGSFRFGYGTGSHTYTDFASVVAGGVYETHGHLVTAPIFASGLMSPSTYTTALTPDSAALASGSDAVDHGMVIPNVTDGYQGAAPDLGAVESGCAAAIYGVRPAGVDESNQTFGCGMGGGAGGGGGSAAGGGAATGGGAGTGGGSATGGGAATGGGSATGGGAATGGGGAATGGGAGGGGGSAAKSGCGCGQFDAGAAVVLALLVLSRRRARQSVA